MPSRRGGCVACTVLGPLRGPAEAFDELSIWLLLVSGWPRLCTLKPGCTRLRARLWSRRLKLRFRLEGGLLSCLQRQESNQRSAAPEPAQATGGTSKAKSKATAKAQSNVKSRSVALGRSSAFFVIPAQAGIQFSPAPFQRKRKSAHRMRANKKPWHAWHAWGKTGVSPCCLGLRPMTRSAPRYTRCAGTRGERRLVQDQGKSAPHPDPLPMNMERGGTTRARRISRPAPAAAASSARRAATASRPG